MKWDNSLYSSESADTALRNTIKLRATASEIAAPKPDLDAKAKKRRFWSTLKKNKRTITSAKIEKICWQITVAAFIRPLQYYLRDPAACTWSIHAAACQNFRRNQWAMTFSEPSMVLVVLASRLLVDGGFHQQLASICGAPCCLVRFRDVVICCRACRPCLAIGSCRASRTIPVAKSHEHPWNPIQIPVMIKIPLNQFK